MKKRVFLLTATLLIAPVYAMQAEAKTATELAVDKKTIDAELKTLEQNMINMNKQFDTYVATYEVLQQEIIDLEADIAVTNDELSERRQIIANRMKAYQAQDSTFSPYIEAFVGADSFTDLVTRTLSVKKIIDADEAMRTNQHEQAATLKKQHATLLEKEAAHEQQFQMMQQQYEEMTVKRAENKAQSLALKEKIATKKEKEQLARERKKAAAQAEKLKKMQQQQVEAIKKVQQQAAANEQAQQQAQDEALAAAQAAQQQQASTTAPEKTSTTDATSHADKASVSTTGGNAGNINFGAKTTDADQQTPTVEGSTTAQGIIAEASKYLGTSYVWGGSTPSTGFDCSGLTSWAFKQNNVSIPRTAAQQYAASTKISASEAKAGDLVFFSYGKGIAHVGIYLGDGRMLNAQNRGVTIDKLAGHWSNYLVGYGRFAGVN